MFVPDLCLFAVPLHVQSGGGCRCDPCWGGSPGPDRAERGRLKPNSVKPRVGDKAPCREHPRPGVATPSLHPRGAPPAPTSLASGRRVLCGGAGGAAHGWRLLLDAAGECGSCPRCPRQLGGHSKRGQERRVGAPGGAESPPQLPQGPCGRTRACRMSERDTMPLTTSLSSTTTSR